MSPQVTEPTPPNPQPDAAAQAGAADVKPAAAPPSKPLEVQWYYSKKGASYGPVTEMELARLARAGEFAKHDSVYGTHLGQWVRADGVHGLFDGTGADDAAEATPLRIPPRQDPPLGDDFLRYAGFWVRAEAALIDLVLVAFFLFVALACVMPGGWLSATAWRATRTLTAGGFQDFASWLVASAFDSGVRVAIALGVFWLYYALLESSRCQATLGKRMCGIIVVSARSRERIGFFRASARYFVSFVSAAAGGIGYLLGAIPRRKRTLHDMVCGTLVIYGKAW